MDKGEKNQQQTPVTRRTYLYDCWLRYWDNGVLHLTVYYRKICRHNQMAHSYQRGVLECPGSMCSKLWNIHSLQNKKRTEDIGYRSTLPLWGIVKTESIDTNF